MGGLLILLPLWITACGPSEDELASQQEPPLFQRKPRPVKASPIEESSPPLFNSTYTYDPTGRRDPFKSLIEPKKITNTATEKEEAVEIVSPLQEYDLSSLTVVGIVWGGLGKRAMIRTPDGKGFTVTENVPIGKGRNRVVQITPESLIIEVISQDDRGKPVKETVVMELRKKEG